MTEETKAWGSIDEYSGLSGRFIPGDYSNAVAIIWRPTRVEKDVPGGYQGKTRDMVVWADFHCFMAMDEVRNGKPSRVLVDAECDAASIARRGEAMVKTGTGVAVPFVLSKESTKTGNTTWVPKAPADDISDRLRAYWDEVLAEEAASSDALDDLGI